MVASAAAFVLSACGSGGTGADGRMPAGSPRSGQGGTPTLAGTLPRPSLGPGPSSVGNVVTDVLAIATGSNDRYAADVVASLGGEIVSTDDRLGIMRARFDVAGVAALLRVRDQLRARGLDASVIPRLDPGDLGSGSSDDPA